MLITLYKIGKLHFRLLATNGFHVKVKSERFTAASSRCRQNLKCENFTSSFGRLHQNIAPKSVPHVQHDYFSSFNQSNHWFVALSLTLPSSNLKLLIHSDAECQNVSFIISPWWKFYPYQIIFLSPNLSTSLPHCCSTVVSVETNLWLQIQCWFALETL